MKKIHQDNLDEKFVSRRQGFDGRLLKVMVDTVTLPNGRQTTREIIAHPGAVCVVPVLDDGSIIFVKQYRYAVGSVLYELPAGKLDHPNEDPLDCAKRELSEETGYEAEHWYYLGRIHNAIGYSDEHLEFFLATGLKAGDRHLDEGECLEVFRVPFKELLEMALNGEITDVKTLVGVFWLEKYLKGAICPQAC